MSNLSDLLPAGAGAKSATFTADGTLATGQAVALKSDGTVGTITGQLGAKSVFEASVYSNAAAAYDTANDKIVVAYGDSGSSNQGTAVVGTISGNTVSFGTPVVFNSGATTGDISIVFDANSGKFVISYRDSGNSDYGTAIVGTVSGTSISFGSETVFNSRYTQSTKLAYDSNAQKVVIAYGDWVSPSYPNGTAIVGTVSGTSISFGTAVAYRAASANIAYNTIAFDSLNNKVVICYRDGGNSDYGTAIVGTVSGTSISFGSAVVFESAYTDWSWPVFDTSAGKIVIAYKDVGNSNAGTAIVGTVSGTSISFGSPTVYQTDNTSFIAGVYNTATGQSFFSSGNITQSSRGEIYPLSVSGTSITVGTRIDYISSVSGQSSPVYDPDTQQVVITFKDGTASNAGTTRTIDPAALQNTDFVGITDEAIADTATGSVVVEGGVITNSQLLPPTYTLSAGSETVYEAAESYENSIVYDPDNGKVIIAYRDGGNSSYGTVIVGTVSGSSISFGSPVVFEAASSSYPSIAYDTTNDKIAIAFTDGGNSNFGTGIVGTVSGTSVTFGSATVFESDTTVDIVSTFDANAGKIVVAYRDIGNSNYGTAVVGTISGTSISYGTPVVFESATSTAISIAYDTNAQKVVISYKDGGNSDYGTSIVGTVSGTSISFGSAVVYEAAGINYSAITYDSTAQKVVIAYNDNGNSGAGTAIVGTVSGTSISFGSPLVVQTNSAFFGLAYDSNADRTVMASANLGSSNRGEMFNLKMTGDTLSTEGSSVVFNAGGTANIFLTYDATAQKVVCAYRDTDNTNYGTSVVATLTESYPSMTTGSTYYVQDDGSLSTTSSSVTAGKALSSTTLLLKG
jgi:hypothetical protein